MSDVGYFYCPYIPLTYHNVTKIMSSNWKEKLASLEMSRLLSHQISEFGLDAVTGVMQEKYPGPYKVVEKYLPHKMKFEYCLEFDSPEEETLWLLKWS